MTRRAAFIMACSGFAGLALEIVWTQQCALWLGHEAPAVLAVVTAFFGGLALGAFALGGRIESSVRPERWYAACELTIAAWALVLMYALPGASDRLLQLIGAQPIPLWQWSVSFVGTFLLLLPATGAMGATLPALERVIAHAGTRSIGGLYAANTTGAVVGVLASAFVLVPALGLRGTILICVLCNVLCATGVLAWARAPDPTVSRAPRAPGGRTPVKVGPLVVLAITGLLGIGYEVLVVRVLSQVAEDTVYTFALLLAGYLIGSAAGAAAWQRAFARRRTSSRTAPRLLLAMGSACLAGTAILFASEHVRDLALALLGPGMGAALAAEAALAMVAFAMPTVVMGALFAQLANQAHAEGASFGLALGVNTLGAALAPLIFGVLAFPWLGPKLSLLLLAAGYLALATRGTWRSVAWWLPAATAVTLALLAPRLAFIEIPDGGRVLSYRDGVMASVSVVEDSSGIARLRIDNREQEGSSATLRVDGRQALLPVLLHPAPRRALFLGLGTGVTSSTAARDPTLSVDAVELLPEVVAAAAQFDAVFDSYDAAPRPHVMVADARRYVRTSGVRYDVVVADNFHPARSGAGSLYTVEHFAAVRTQLSEQGVFCQWLPLHQLDLGTFRVIVHSYISVYPNAWAILASNSLDTPVVGLVARADGQRFDANALRTRLARAGFSPSPAALGIEDDLALFGSFIAGPDALRVFAGDSALNTDDRPVVAYLAPRITYAPDSLPRERLMQLLARVHIEPRELVAQSSDDAWRRRLAAYWRARDRFIVAGSHVRPTRDVHDMLAQVREPLLAVLRESPDFRPAYDPLLAMANALAPTDADDARVLLAQLATVQPARHEATLALGALASR